MLSKEELAEARKQLSDQVEAMPDGQQKEAARAQLASLSDEAITSMVEQQRQPAQKGPQKGIFRMIVDGDVPSKKLDENKESIAVLSVRAVSRGHVLVIPRKPVDDARNLPASALSLAKKIARKMPSKLGAEATEIQTSSAFGEVIVNAIAVYDKPVSVNSQPYEVKEDELEACYKALRVVKAPKREKIKVRSRKVPEGNILKLKRRVP